MKKRQITNYDNFKGGLDILSGVIAMYNDRILMVLPTKFKNKWSIPKGHVKNNKKFKSAKKEFFEETGIELTHKSDIKFSFHYVKNNTVKEITIYYYELTDDDLEDIEIENYKILSGFDTNEISEVKFMKKKKALLKCEPFLNNILNVIFNKK